MKIRINESENNDTYIYTGGQAPKDVVNVVVDNNVEVIARGAFTDCKRLENITIPNGVTHIKGWAFSGCESLKNITIPNSVTYIGDHAFYYCRNLTHIEIPNSIPIKSIKEGTFGSSPKLKNIIIPDSVTSIEEEAFAGCNGITNITIPNGVRSIGKRAFFWCRGLNSITVPNSVEQLGFAAFPEKHYLTVYTDNEYVANYCKEWEITVKPMNNSKNVSKSTDSVNDDTYLKIGKAILNYFNNVTFESDGIYIHCSNKDKAIKLYKKSDI